MRDPVRKMVDGLLPDGTLIRACEVTFEYFRKQEDRIEKLEAVTKDELLHCFHRINELQTALRMVIDWDNTLDWDDGPAWGDLMDIARKALEGKDE